MDLLSVTYVLVQVAAHAAFSDSISARKLAVELAGRQMTIRSHNGALFEAALLLLKAGKSLPAVCKLCGCDDITSINIMDIAITITITKLAVL